MAVPAAEMELALRVFLMVQYANVSKVLVVWTALCSVLRASQEQIARFCWTAGFMGIAMDTVSA